MSGHTIPRGTCSGSAFFDNYCTRLNHQIFEIKRMEYRNGLTWLLLEIRFSRINSLEPSSGLTCCYFYQSITRSVPGWTILGYDVFKECQIEQRTLERCRDFVKILLRSPSTGAISYSVQGDETAMPKMDSRTLQSYTRDLGRGVDGLLYEA
jgi:hypothetical protein